jgi:opacity protein-like surface antigen
MSLLCELGRAETLRPEWISMKRTTKVTILGANLILAAASLLAPSRADASAIDLTASGGFIKRSLADTSYRTGFTWQLNGDLTFFPALMMGPYIGFASTTPDIDGANSISFRTIGARVKLKLPIPGQVQPFGVAGAGWAHADFPDQTVQVCVNNSCARRTVPSATANFVEFLVGGGLIWTPVAPLAFTAEFNWRPTTGYTNDTYENQIQTGQTSAPSPTRNGVAWVGLLGIGLSL